MSDDNSFLAEISNTVRAALREDIGPYDFTAMLVPADRSAHASVISRDSAVLCGTPWFERCFRQLDSNTEIDWRYEEGAEIPAGSTLCSIHGSARALLTAERTALNFLQSLSATATETRRYVVAVSGTGARIYDTRKTLPGLRVAQKYAVQIGGGHNHRMGLYGGVLIKENHIVVAGGIEQVLRAAEQTAPARLPLQIEVESCAQLEEALAAGAKLILLDNFSVEEMRAAVRIAAGRAELEASGGITMSNVREVAETGVDRISIGSITKDISAVDLSMRIAID